MGKPAKAMPPGTTSAKMFGRKRQEADPFLNKQDPCRGFHPVFCRMQGRLCLLLAWLLTLEKISTTYLRKAESGSESRRSPCSVASCFILRMSASLSGSIILSCVNLSRAEDIIPLDS